ncbi:MAG: hypothetical protein JXA17_05820 [Dehalococcoidales bacterium]|nr:hypothetical protein [Dehalococcoidales bacterium]
MKKLLLIISLVSIFLLFSLASWSCGSAGSISASLGQEFTLPVGKTATIESESLSIQFVGVISDSRCPEGVECIWAGEANCRLHFTIAGSPAEMVVAQPGGGDVAARDYFIQYKIDFRLEPYPQEGQTIAPSDYRLIMRVTK